MKLSGTRSPGSRLRPSGKIRQRPIVALVLALRPHGLSNSTHITLFVLSSPDPAFGFEILTVGFGPLSSVD